MPWGGNAARLRAFKGGFGSSKISGAPSQLYVALCRQATAGQEATTLGSEPDSTGNYARVAVANDDTFWSYLAAGGENAVEIRWPTSTSTYSITSALNQWALYDNSAIGSGELIAFGALSTAITVTGAGETPVVPIGALDLTIGT